MPNCNVCGREYDDLRLRCGTCDNCRREAGTLEAESDGVLMPRIPCERCGGRSFVRSVFRQRTGASDLQPRAIFYQARAGGRIGAPRLAVAPLDTYTCLGCGRVELYTRDPASIPIGPAYGTELVEVPERGYR